MLTMMRLGRGPRRLVERPGGATTARTSSKASPTCCSGRSRRATRRGLVHGYRHTEERLPVLRGRLDIQALAARPWEQVADPVPLRRLHRGRRREPGPSRGRRARRAVADRPRVLRRSVADVRQRLAEVGDIARRRCWRPSSCGRPRSTSTTSRRWRSARLVLEGVGLTQVTGGVSALTFLVDMNKLFEKWIGDELTTRLWPELEVVRAAPGAAEPVAAGDAWPRTWCSGVAARRSSWPT